MITTEPQIHWVSANSLIEEQTRQIAREFGNSRPRPRNRQMGFKQEPKRAKRNRELWDLLKEES